MNARTQYVALYPDDRAERLAHILGPNSAAAKALVELKDRRSKGEDVVLMIVGSDQVQGGFLMVGPPIASSEAQSRRSE